jgi:hypothetical protein
MRTLRPAAGTMAKLCGSEESGVRSEEKAVVVEDSEIGVGAEFEPLSPVAGVLSPISSLLTFHS